jgi:hypothetical protein
MAVACLFWACQFLYTEEDDISRFGARVAGAGVG